MGKQANARYGHGEGMEVAGVCVVSFWSGLGGGEGGEDVGELLLSDWEVQVFVQGV